MKRTFFLLGALLLILCIGNAQSPKFIQSNNSDVMGQGISRVDGGAAFPRNYAGGVALDFTGDGLKDFIMPFYYSPSNNFDVQFLKLFKNHVFYTFLLNLFLPFIFYNSCSIHFSFVCFE